MRQIIVGAIIGALSASAVAASVALASASANGVINGCYQKNNGQLRVVDALEQCQPSEVAIYWNEVGPTGAAGPQGPTGPQGPKGDTGPQGPAGAGRTLSALEDLAGVPCNMGAGAGTVAVTYGTPPNATITFTCNVGAANALTVNVVASDGARGVVTSNPTGVSCPADCSASFASSTTVQLTAVSQSGSRFLGWSGDCTGTDTCTITMTAARTVTASFAPGSTLTVTASVGSSYVVTCNRGWSQCTLYPSGSVTSTPAGIACGVTTGGTRTCQASFPPGTSVSVAAYGSEIRSITWGGDCAVATGTTCALTMDSDHNVTVRFD